MTDKPILFSAPMARALLAGRKTMTRRVLNPQPPGDVSAYGWTAATGARWESGAICGRIPIWAGDRLWVREAWFAHSTFQGTAPRNIPPTNVFYVADDKYAPSGSSARSPLHMPRWASRLTLIVEDVRVQRLQEISEADAIAEGVGPFANSQTIDCDTQSPRMAYAELWDSLHGKGAWQGNPWVGCYSFRVIKANIDSAEAK